MHWYHLQMQAIIKGEREGLGSHVCNSHDKTWQKRNALLRYTGDIRSQGRQLSSETHGIVVSNFSISEYKCWQGQRRYGTCYAIAASRSILSDYYELGAPPCSSARVLI